MSIFIYLTNKIFNLSASYCSLKVVAVILTLLVGAKTVWAEVNPAHQQEPATNLANEQFHPFDLDSLFKANPTDTESQRTEVNPTPRHKPITDPLSEDELLFDLDNALNKNPTDAKSHAQLGRIFYENGLFDQSINAFLKASEIDPYYTEIYNKLTNLLGKEDTTTYTYTGQSPVDFSGVETQGDIEGSTPSMCTNLGDGNTNLHAQSDPDYTINDTVGGETPDDSPGQDVCSANTPQSNETLEASTYNKPKMPFFNKYFTAVNEFLGRLVNKLCISDEDKANSKSHLFIIRILIFTAVGLVAYTAFSLIPGNKNPTKSRLARLRYPAARSSGLKTPLSQAKRKEAHFLKERLYALGQIIIPRGEEARNKMKMELARAGYRRRDAVNLYSGIKVLVAIILMVAFVMAGVTLKMKPGLIVVFTPAFAGLGMYFPILWLRLKARKRKARIITGFPDALDLLAVCVDAGLGLNAAMARVSDEIGFANRDLSDEFQLVNLEIRAGKPRPEALHNLGERTDIEDIQALVAMLIQADRFGTSIAQSLRIHSDASRTKRKLRAEEAAAKTTVKMVFPLLLFILPALFVVVMGPALLQIIQNMGSNN